MANNWQRRAEDAYAKREAESKALGDAYLKLWARWYRQDGAPRMIGPSMNRIAKPGYPDPPRPRMDDETAAVIDSFILRLPEDEEEAVRGYYVRRRRRKVSHTAWDEPLRYWHTWQLAELLGTSERTLYRRIASARSRIESWADEMGLLPP